jgi:hypothetical protein
MTWDDFLPEFDKRPEPTKVPLASDLTYFSIDDLKKIPRQEWYRLIVDGQYHKEQNGWLGYATREPNCLPASFNALEYALNDLTDQNISVEFIKNIHKSATENVEQLNSHTIPGELRFSHGGYILEQRYQYPFMSKEGFLQLHQKVNDELIKYGACIISMTKQEAAFLNSKTYYQQVGAMKNSTVPAEELWENSEPTLHPQVLFYRAPDAKHLNMLLEKVCQKYNVDIKNATTPEEKLKIIATAVQQIEQLHVFPDANGRTSTILLQRLLLQNGFFPAMLYNPNHIDGYSLDELIDEIKKGVNHTKTMTTHPEQPLHDYKTVPISLGPSTTLFTIQQQSLNETIKRFYLAEDKFYQFIQSLKPSFAPQPK